MPSAIHSTARQPGLFVVFVEAQLSSWQQPAMMPRPFWTGSLYGPYSPYRVKVMQKALTIGDLARKTGVKVVTIRYYERIGLLPAPARTGTGAYRSYGNSDLGRLSFIRKARDLGFTLDQIRALLNLAEQRDHDCADVDAIAREHLAEVERKIADLSALRRELRELIGSCSRGPVADCRIIEALSPA